MDGDIDAFEKLAGTEQDFYGVDNTHFRLGDTVWNAVEDENDGYRSYLGSIVETKPDNLVFPRSPLARVRVDEYDSDAENGFRLVDVADGHCWLRVGTDNTDDYYPSFVFDYAPKPPLL